MSSGTLIPNFPTIVLIGLESVGKSAIFRQLTGEATGDETNFRGSTVRVRRGALRAGGGEVVDTPGIRLQADSHTTHLALQQAASADTLLLVARGTHARQEIDTLLGTLGSDLHGRKAALAITFADWADPQLPRLLDEYRTRLGVPITLLNARTLAAGQHQRLLTTIAQAAPLQQRAPISLLPDIPPVQPQTTIFEQPLLGPLWALLSIALLFGLPVYLAYLLAEWAQPWADRWLIAPLVAGLTPVSTLSPLLYSVLAGDYGLLTLGWYSFLWAFPVVLLIGVSVAICDETGLKDRLTAALDAPLRRIGLNGRDLLPVLTGFGCNVVAVLQSRACSRCTRQSCVSLIAFGSACSYQIGASLSLFGSAQAPWLFAPYLLLLFVVGAIHTRLWQGGLAASAALPLAERAFLQAPTWQGIWWRVRAVLRQFVGEALPIFFAICAVGALLDYAGLLAWLATAIAPALALFGLPGEVAPGVIFSMVRKDGLLALNQGAGALLASLGRGQIFLLVYLCSTLTACLVTLWAIRKELGWRTALTLAGRQALTALGSTWLLAWVMG